jgi:drug/metabolite transporter (DMT)-like permease
MSPPSPQVIGAVLALGIMCTGIAYILYFSLLQSAGATNTLLVTLLIPVSALLLATLLLHERFTAMQGVGMGCIGLGLGVMAYAARQKKPTVAAATE